jgi:type III secretion protein U
VGAKSEEPTPRRLRRAREEGGSGASAFASQAVALVAATALVPVTISAVASRVEDRLRDAIHRAAEPVVTASFDAGQAARDLVLLCLPILAGAAMASAATSLIQTGGILGARRLAPRLERLNPLMGLDRLVSRQRLFAAARAVAAGSLVGWIVLHHLSARAGDIARASGRLVFAGPTAIAIAERIGWSAALLGVAVAALDIVVTRSDWTRRLRMSRDEVRRELKETGGDPVARGARDRARLEASALGAIAAVRTATVVVWDGQRAACALRYEDGDLAPRVVASGNGAMADAIVREARTYGVATAEDVELAHALAACSAGESIPETLYDPVAVVLRDLTT